MLHVLAAALTCFLAQVVRADEAKTNDTFVVTLTDGTALVCRPELAAFPLKMPYAEIKAPLNLIQNIKFDHKKNVVSVAFLNGDQLQAACPLEGITVESLLGSLQVSASNIVSITSMLKREPVYEDTPARRSACINNLRIIDSAKEQTAMANGFPDGSVVSGQQIGEYIKGGWPALKCPAGGTYSINPVGVDPECSVPGHSLRH